MKQRTYPRTPTLWKNLTSLQKPRYQLIIPWLSYLPLKLVKTSGNQVDRTHQSLRHKVRASMEGHQGRKAMRIYSLIQSTRQDGSRYNSKAQISSIKLVANQEVQFQVRDTWSKTETGAGRNRLRDTHS